jgi:hypothetical protein
VVLVMVVMVVNVRVVLVMVVNVRVVLMNVLVLVYVPLVPVALV